MRPVFTSIFGKVFKKKCSVTFYIVKQPFLNNKKQNNVHSKKKNYSTSSYPLDKQQTGTTDDIQLVSPHSSSLDETALLLDLTNYADWTKEQVCSLLCLPKTKGGASLSEDDVKPLYKANFKGTSISNIIDDIKIQKKHMDRIVDEYLKVFPMVPHDTIKTVVFWVNNLLNTKLSHLLSDTLPYITKENVSLLDLDRFFVKNQKDYSDLALKTSLVSSFGSDFKFVERENIVNEVVMLFRSRPVEKDLDKQDVVFPFVVAAPGVGKSRVLQEIGIYITKSPVRQGFRTIPLFVSYGNASSLDKSEKDILQSLIARMIFSAFVQKSSYSPASFSIFLRDWTEYIRNREFDLSEALIIISKILQVDYEKTDFFLAFDEAHRLDLQVRQNNPLKEIMSHLGKYISKHRKSNLFVMLAGTYYTPIHDNLLGSTYIPHFIPLKASLSTTSVQEILDALSLNYPSLRNWRTNSNFRHYLRSFSGFPRGVEYFLKEYLLSGAGNEPSLLSSWEKAKVSLRRSYGNFLGPTARVYLSKIIFSKMSIEHRQPFPTTNFTFSDLENFGAVMINTINSDTQIAVYPTVLLEKLIPRYLRETFELLYLKNPLGNTYGLSWVDIIHNYHYLLLSLLKGVTLSLYDLFRFAKMNGKTGLTQVRVGSEDVEMPSSTYRIQGDYNAQTALCSKHFIEELEELEKCVVMKNGTSDTAGDCLIFGVTLKDEKDTILVIHLQGKWADSGNGALSYDTILNELYQRNKLFKFTNTKLKTRNITVILTGKPILKCPSAKDFPDDLIIVDKSNFDNYFVNFSGQSSYIHASPALHVNEFTENQLLSFEGIGKATAQKILQARPLEGFKTKESVKSVIDNDALYDRLEHFIVL
ncbi:hypothetical protein ABK040_011018 [Willaertia magna]